MLTTELLTLIVVGTLNKVEVDLITLLEKDSLTTDCSLTILSDPL